MKYIKTFEQFVNESSETESVNEARSINTISSELEKVGKEMKSTVDKWKKEKDEDKKNELKDRLKELTTKKKSIKKELDDAVAKLDKEVELQVEESFGADFLSDNLE